PRVLLLGVTPELATLPWPAGTELVAIDRSAAMIGALFPTTGVPAGARAARGEWLALPRADRSVDLAVGDGCLSNLGFAADYRRFAAELARVLADDGRLLLRLFAAPPAPESLAEIGAALAAGAIGSMHALKWRLAMAVQPAHRNVAVVDIRRAFDELVVDRAALAARTGWPDDVIATIDNYRGSSLVYSFPTADEVDAALAPALVRVHRHAPAYELGDRCPTVVWSRAV
ncbi:MAG: methyltransferase domain-containing protein, partial [Candidatus Competibacteraceae bacterium]|nr:methyltransferase domain-containing protein [Candidatus Competibacteraceae bacterium]